MNDFIYVPKQNNMNREIKFRAWDNINKKWGLGYEYPRLGGFSMKGETMAFGEYSRVLNSFPIEKWDDLILMQYTGLKDENRVEIYEGDLVQFLSGRILAVEWNDDICQYQFSDGSPINDGDNYGTWKLVIGNIYENPELLKPQTT